MQKITITGSEGLIVKELSNFFKNEYSKVTTMKSMMKKTEFNYTIDLFCNKNLICIIGTFLTVGGYSLW
jgi:hypothetical protein